MGPKVFCAISSVVERHIDIVKAGGPIPPSRTGAFLSIAPVVVLAKAGIQEKNIARVAQW